MGIQLLLAQPCLHYLCRELDHPPIMLVLAVRIIPPHWAPYLVDSTCLIMPLHLLVADKAITTRHLCLLRFSTSLCRRSRSFGKSGHSTLVLDLPLLELSFELVAPIDDIGTGTLENSVSTCQQRRT